MRAVLIAGGLAMILSLFGTPLFIRLLVRKQYGQFIRQDGPTAHFTKRGTPTMGGVVILAATLLGWGGALLITGGTPSASALVPFRGFIVTKNRGENLIGLLCVGLQWSILIVENRFQKWKW